MSAAAIQAAAILAVVLLALGLVFYSMCVAAHKADERVEDEAACLQAAQRTDSLGWSTTAFNMALVLAAFCLIGAVHVWLPGPTAAQAKQNIADYVAELEGTAHAAEASTRVRHASSALPARRPHVSVLAEVN